MDPRGVGRRYRLDHQVEGASATPSACRFRRTRCRTDGFRRGGGQPDRHALLHDEEQELWALGPASLTGRDLTSAQAPPLTLPDVNGSLFSLETLRGQKVLLVAWASGEAP